MEASARAVTRSQSSHALAGSNPLTSLDLRDYRFHTHQVALIGADRDNSSGGNPIRKPNPPCDGCAHRRAH